MPNTYAHYRFGQDVKRKLLQSGDSDIRRLIDSDQQLYMIGLHGPDILFYYHPLWNNPISNIGFSMHNWTGRRFLQQAVDAVNRNTSRRAATAYLIGFVCHFTLDSICHPYVEEVIHQDGFDHTEIEGAFDRALMIHDGLNPVIHPLTDHIHPSQRNAAIIAPFFPPADAGQVYRALRSMTRFNSLITTDDPVRRGAIMSILRAAGCYDTMHGMVITRHKEERFAKSSRQLWQLYHEALQAAPEMIREALDLADGNDRLDHRFDHTFSYF